MPSGITAHTIAVGRERLLSIQQGEDREFRLTFTVDDAPLDMTGASAVVMTVRNRTTGILMLARAYAGFQGAATDGTPRFVFLGADTADQSVGPYDVDVIWTDADGNQCQLLAASTLTVTEP